MSVRNTHVPVDRLTALAFVARAPFDGAHGDGEPDDHALTHIAQCERCAGELARLTVDADTMRAAAFAQADAVFDDAMLDAQRTRILDRLAHLGQAARVLRFPARSREVAMPVSVNSRGWVSVAAAAGLIIGLVTGQMIHYMPAWDVASPREGAIMQAPSRQNAFVPVSTSDSSLSDDQLLAEIDADLSVRASASAFRTLDRLTPLEDFHAMGR